MTLNLFIETIIFFSFFHLTSETNVLNRPRRGVEKCGNVLSCRNFGA
jgi:hypothetical protein